MEWLTRDDLLEIHKIVTRLPVSAYDRHKLDSALTRPFTDVFGKVLYPTIWDKAACLLHSIVTTHPFTEDGNKRAAWVAAKTVLVLNGWHLRTEPADGEAFVLGIATHEVEIPAAARWLEGHSAQAAGRTLGS